MSKSCEKCLFIIIAMAILINLYTVWVFYIMIQTNLEEKSFHLVYPGTSIKREEIWHYTKDGRGIDQILTTIGQSSLHSSSTVWLSGLIIDVEIISDEIWKVVFELNCQYNVGIHIITKEISSIERGFQKRNIFLKSTNNSSHLSNSNKLEHDCGPFILHLEEKIIWNYQSNVINNRNRIDRISTLRDYQRNALRKEFNDDVSKDGVIMLVDLDLLQIPTAEEIWNQIELLKSPRYPHDSICALGTKVNFSKGDDENKVKQVPFYYDTYATIFQNDTFSHPLSRRLIPSYYKGEDPKLVRSNDSKHGSFTQGHIWKYFKTIGMRSSTGNVQVRSCFGGLAMYRSRLYFDSKCQYQLQEGIMNKLEKIQSRSSSSVNASISSSIIRYASKKERRPCEHVVLNDCLIRKTPSFNIALNPNLVTIWKRR